MLLEIRLQSKQERGHVLFLLSGGMLHYIILCFSDLYRIFVI